MSDQIRMDDSAPRAVTIRHHLLDRESARDFVRSRPVATISFTLNNRVKIEPVYCALDPDFEDWLYIRTMPGSLLAREMRNQWVAINARAERSATDWTSAVVYGKLYVLATTGEDPLPKVHARAVDLLQPVAPDMATAERAALDEEILYRVSVETLTARVCTPE